MASGSNVAADHARRQSPGPPPSPSAIIGGPLGGPGAPIAPNPQGPLRPPTVSVPGLPTVTISSTSGTVKPTVTRTSTSSSTFTSSSTLPSSPPATSIITPSPPPVSTPSPSALPTFTSPPTSSTSVSFTTASSESPATTSTSISWTMYEAANTPATDIPSPLPRHHASRISPGLAAALGVISTLAFVVLILVVVLILRRRQRRRFTLAPTDFEIQNPDPRYGFIGAGYSSRMTRAGSSNLWTAPPSAGSDTSKRTSGASSVFPTFLPRPQAAYSSESSSEDSLWEVLTILPRQLSPPPRYASALPSQLAAIARAEKEKQGPPQTSQAATLKSVKVPTFSLVEQPRASAIRSLTAQFGQQAVPFPTAPSGSPSVRSVPDAVTSVQHGQPIRRSVQFERQRSSTDSGRIQPAGRAASRPGTGRSGQTFGRHSRSLEGEPFAPTGRGSIDAARPNTGTTDAAHDVDPTIRVTSPTRVRFSVDTAEKRKSDDSDESS